MKQGERFMYKVLYSALVICTIICSKQSVVSMSFEDKCKEVSNKLLMVVMTTHIEKFRDKLLGKEFGQQELDHNNTGGNCCAVAFFDEDSNVEYLQHEMLPLLIAQVSSKGVIDGKNIAVFSSGKNSVVSQVFDMFNTHYTQLFPLQGVPITLPNGRHVDAEEQLLLALDSAEVRERLQNDKWRTMIIVSSMDTCKYCAISISGFLCLNQKLAFGKSPIAYKLKGIKFYYPFSYKDPSMRLELGAGSHILLLPPHVEHIQFSKTQSINTIAQIAQVKKDIELLNTLCQKCNQTFELEMNFMIDCWKLNKLDEVNVHQKLTESILSFVNTPKNKQNFLENVFVDIDQNLDKISGENMLLMVLKDAALTTDDVPNKCKRKGDIIRRMRKFGIKINNFNK